MKKVTILDAVERVLKEGHTPKSLREIHEGIVTQGLYDFKAKDALGVIRGTIRKHLKGSGEDSPARIVAAGADRFSLPRQ